MADTPPISNNNTVRSWGTFIKDVGLPAVVVIIILATAVKLSPLLVNQHEIIIQLLRYNQAVGLANFYTNNAICLNEAERHMPPDAIQQQKRRCESVKDQMLEYLWTMQPSRGQFLYHPPKP